jgi:hypothetical protein
MEWCVPVNSVRLLLHKSQDPVCRVADEPDEVSEFGRKAVKVKVQRIPALSRARSTSNSELGSSL